VVVDLESKCFCGRELFRVWFCCLARRWVLFEGGWCCLSEEVGVGWGVCWGDFL
jgi:hypothetical protein